MSGSLRILLLNKGCKTYIDKKTVTNKGVIANWPYGITELWGNIIDKQDIISIENMKKILE